MLIKLLATKMVAKSFFGLSNNFEIISMGFEFSCEAFSISVCVNENSATSAPETKAEHSNNTNSKITPKAIEVSMAKVFIIKLKGSGSKY